MRNQWTILCVQIQISLRSVDIDLADTFHAGSQQRRDRHRPGAPRRESNCAPPRPSTVA